MRLELRVEVKFGAMSDSVFPKLEILLENKEYIEAVQRFNKANEYDYLIDFLFIEMFPAWRTTYVKFKKYNGPKLIDHPSLTENILKEWDKALCKCVKTAHKHMSWTNFAKDCKKL